jgi:ABC-type branched-subunit amino acid transport system ATPase component
MAQRNIAQVDGLSHRYGDAVAVEDIDLQVPAGNIVGLIGPRR